MANSNDTASAPVAPLPVHIAARWSALTAGNFKINIDASLNIQEGIIGLGIIIRDSAGVVLASSAQRIASPFPPPLAEALGILRGLIFAKESGLLPTALESDALAIVNAICAPPSLADLGILVFDI
ncbi:hypothetical protein ACOSQ3_018604 [Xanthoceras sorbifolium]